MSMPVSASIPMKIFDLIVIGTVFLMQTLLFAPEWQNFLIAVVGSLTGSIILAYFRREIDKWELLLKVFCSAIGGFVLGTVLCTYFNITNPNYRLGLFVATAMLALTILRALLNLTERNGQEVVRDVLQRLLGVRLAEKQLNSMPSITITPNGEIKSKENGE